MCGVCATQLCCSLSCIISRMHQTIMLIGAAEGHSSTERLLGCGRLLLASPDSRRLRGSTQWFPPLQVRASSDGTGPIKAHRALGAADVRHLCDACLPALALATLRCAGRRQVP